MIQPVALPAGLQDHRARQVAAGGRHRHVRRPDPEPPASRSENRAENARGVHAGAGTSTRRAARATPAPLPRSRTGIRSRRSAGTATRPGSPGHPGQGGQAATGRGLAALPARRPQKALLPGEAVLKSLRPGRPYPLLCPGPPLVNPAGHRAGGRAPPVSGPPQRTPRGRNWTLIRGPVGRAVFGTRAPRCAGSCRPSPAGHRGRRS